MSESSNENALRGKEYAKAHNGEHLGWTSIPNSWVIDGNLPDKIWDNLPENALPLKPDQFDRNNTGKYEIGQRLLKKRTASYGEGTFMLLLYDDKNEAFAEFVIPNDLKKSPDELTREYNNAPERPKELRKMKLHALEAALQRNISR